EKDIVVGSPTSGRYHPDISRVAGMFANSLVVRTTIDEDLTFPEFLKVVHRNFLNAIDHQEYPFEELVKVLNVRRDMSRNPLFNVIFAFQNDYESKFGHNDIVVEKTNLLEETTGTAKVDLAFWCKANFSSIVIDVEYATSLFNRSTVEAWCCLYHSMVALCMNENVSLETILAGSDGPLSLENAGSFSGQNSIV
ncbi:MAG: hypothetical protein ICV84_22290, partial [Flavisolibacter sp.]|nr:hypothetical protein [Flavisolibacter sp.]